MLRHRPEEPGSGADGGDRVGTWRRRALPPAVLTQEELWLVQEAQGRGHGSRWCSQPGLLPCRQLPAEPQRCHPQPGLELGLCCPDAFVIARWAGALAQSGGRALHAAVPRHGVVLLAGGALLWCWVKGAPADRELTPRWGELKQVFPVCLSAWPACPCCCFCTRQAAGRGCEVQCHGHNVPRLGDTGCPPSVWQRV